MPCGLPCPEGRAAPIPDLLRHDFAAAFAATCGRLGITQSIGGVGCALGNAAAESFFSTLHGTTSATHGAATAPEPKPDKMSAWIDTWYNRRRRHAPDNMASPVQYEAANAA